MKPDPAKLIEPSREDLIRAISHAMLFQGRKRSHHWDSTNAQIAAEKLIDGLAAGNYVIMRGPPSRAPGDNARDIEAAVRAAEESFND